MIHKVNILTNLTDSNEINFGEVMVLTLPQSVLRLVKCHIF